MRDKNHEGYHDPTACEALRRVHRRKKPVAGRYGNGFLLKEIPGFQEVKKAIAR